MHRSPSQLHGSAASSNRKDSPRMLCVAAGETACLPDDSSALARAPSLLVAFLSIWLLLRTAVPNGLLPEHPGQQQPRSTVPPCDLRPTFV